MKFLRRWTSVVFKGYYLSIEKQRTYNERVMQVEHRSFTPLVMSASGGMGRECRRFYARLAEMIAEKRKQNYFLIASWIWRKICFALINSICICIRDSGTVFPSKNLEISLTEDVKVSVIISRFQWILFQNSPYV